MDELIKAKKLLETWEIAKAGPVAELKGELFYQPSKATEHDEKMLTRMAARFKVPISGMWHKKYRSA